MNKKQFCEKIIGVPWASRKYSYEETDCHGLVYLFYRDVLCIDIKIPPSYHDLSLESEERYLDEVSTNNWVEIQGPADGCMVLTCYRGGRPVHVGIMLDKVNVLHAWGSQGMGGSVKITPLSVIIRMFGKVSFHIRKEQL